MMKPWTIKWFVAETLMLIVAWVIGMVLYIGLTKHISNGRLPSPVEWIISAVVFLIAWIALTFIQIRKGKLPIPKNASRSTPSANQDDPA